MEFTQEEPTKTEEINMPEEFAKIIKDFISDISVTFPEFKPLIAKWWKDNSKTTRSSYHGQFPSRCYFTSKM